MAVFRENDLAQLSAEVRPALERAHSRVVRALEAGDVEGTIGAAKELVETTAKVVLDAFGETAGSDVELPKLVHQAIKALELHPAGLEGRASLRRLAQAMISTACAIAELRNSDGTGHGRPYISNLQMEHAEFAMESAKAWCRWVLWATAQVLEGRATVNEGVGKISREIVRTGEISAILAALRLPDLNEEDQRRLGLASARRWNVSGTFVARNDVVRPLADGSESFPTEFTVGVIEGLLLDHNGYLHTEAENLRYVIDIGLRLPEDLIEPTFDKLTDRLVDAQLSPAWTPQKAADVNFLANEAMGEYGGQHPRLADALFTIANKISGDENFRPDQAPS
jgi:hypothetical protein